MFFRSIIPDARHWSRCWTASAVQWVGLLVVVRWKTSKAFMLVFLFCRRHFESGDLFVLAAAVVRLKLRNAIIVRLYLGDWKHLLRPPCLLVIAIAASKAANCLYIAIISRWLKASLASTLPSLVIAMTLALSRATHIQRHFAYYISHETILICVLDPVSMPFSSITATSSPATSLSRMISTQPYRSGSDECNLNGLRWRLLCPPQILVHFFRNICWPLRVASCRGALCNLVVFLWCLC